MTDRGHKNTLLVEMLDAARSHAGAARFNRPPAGAGRGKPADKVDDTAPPLGTLISGRRSGGLVRRPITAGALSRVLAAAPWSTLESVFGPDAPLPELYCLTQRVDGLTAGLFRWSGEHGYGALEPPDGPVAGADLFIQLEHQTASAAIFTVVPLAGWLARAGDRGYRAIALQAGMLADAFYLVAEAEGLTYSASGSFPPATLDRVLGLDGVTKTTFFSFVLGGARA